MQPQYLWKFVTTAVFVEICYNYSICGNLLELFLEICGTFWKNLLQLFVELCNNSLLKFVTTIFGNFKNLLWPLFLENVSFRYLELFVGK